MTLAPRTASPTTHPAHTRANTRERLIEAAKVLFAKQGYDGTSVKEIAKAAKVNISLISYHFEGKEGLYCECLSSFGTPWLERAQRILTPPTTLEEFRVRLHLFVEELLVSHLDQPEVSRIVMRECELKLPVARDVFLNTFFKVFELLVTYFNHAKTQGWVRKEIETEAAMSLFLGGIVHSSQKDGLNEEFFGKTIKDRKYREALISTTISLFLDGCLYPKSQGVTRDS